MNESFSPVLFLYGMAVVVAMAKACTLFIWRTLPKPRPPVRQEIREAWRRRQTRGRTASDSPRPATDSHPTLPPSDKALTEQLR